MKRALDSWAVTCVSQSASVVWAHAQTGINEALRWTSATVEQARSWALVANNAANVYAARLVAAHIASAVK
jgi:hypothetical protein